MNLSAFLRSLSHVDRDGHLTAVLGNEAADLDSMASSVLYAHLLSATKQSGGRDVLPIINIPRSDFSLRTEAVWLFSEAGVDVDSLVFIDEVDLESIQKSGHLDLVLVDHNKLPAFLSSLSAPVVEVVDHHADEGLYPDAKRDVAPVGSCATLIAERYLASMPDLLDKSTAKLLLGTILLDTVNLDPEAKRATSRDEDAVGQLLKVAGMSRNELFDKLQFEKFNVASLSSRDILRKDYKEYVMGSIRCGISSALLPLRDWTKKDPHIEDSFRAYAEDRNLNLLLAMSAYTAPEFHRELAVFTADEALRSKVVEILNGAGMGLTELAVECPEATPILGFYSQANAGGSRKKLQPILAEKLSGA